MFQHEELSMHMLADLRTVWQARERLGGGLSFRSMFHDVPMWFSITSEGDFRVQEEYTTGACDLYLDQSPSGGWTLHTEDGVRRLLLRGEARKEGERGKRRRRRRRMGGMRKGEKEGGEEKRKEEEKGGE